MNGVFPSPLLVTLNRDITEGVSTPRNFGQPPGSISRLFVRIDQMVRLGVVRKLRDMCERSHDLICLLLGILGKCSNDTSRLKMGTIPRIYLRGVVASGLGLR